MIRFFLLSAMFISSVMLSAQSNKNPKPPKRIFPQTFGDLNLTLGIPMYNYDDVSSSTPFGLTFNVLHQPRNNTPVLFGGGISYLNAGNNRVNRDLTADIMAGSLLIDQLYIPLEFRMNNHILNGHAMIRFQATNKYFKPYLDLLGGFNYLWTGTAVYDRSPERFFAADNEDGLITRKTQLNDITWSAGFGVGAYIYLNESIYLNINASYMGGGWSNYYDRDQIKNWDIQLNVNGFNPNNEAGSLNEDDLAINGIPKNSRTDMIHAQLGIGFYLSGQSAQTQRPRAQPSSGTTPPRNSGNVSKGRSGRR